jgi:hypothetical protein
MGMPARTRKLIGTIVLLVFVGLYAWVAGTIGAGRITLAPPGRNSPIT